MLTNMNFTVAGWGATESAPTSDVLLDSNLNYTLNAECERKFRQRVFQFRLLPSQMCAQGVHLESNSCVVDSGGPLMSRNLKNGFQIMGVSSFGNARCQSLTPGVFTRVSNYLKFIKDYVFDNAII